MIDKKEAAEIIIGAVLLAAGLVIHFTGGDALTEAILLGAGCIICGYEVVMECVSNIRGGTIFDENLLMTIAVVGAFLIGEYPEALAVLLFYRVGEMFEHYAVDRSRRSIAALTDIMPDTANVIRDGKTISVSPSEVEVGEKVLIKPGDKVPIDCKVLEGASSVDTKALTGESMPRDIDAGDELFGGFINLTGPITAETLRPYGESAVSRIMEMIEDSASRKASSERFITVFARYYTPAVCLISFLVFLLPVLLLGGAVQTWLYRALTILVVSCPCALVISVPMSFFCGIGGASKLGILVKGGNFLEMLAKTETVVFDKTGTLTKGTFSVSKIHPSENMTEDQLIEMAAEAEFYSSHPISLSIKEMYGKAIDPAVVGASQNVPGRGVITEVKGSAVHIGNLKMMSAMGHNATDACCKGTKIHIATENGGYLGHIAVSDVAKADSVLAVKALKEDGIKTVMLTGDNGEVAEAIAKEVGVDEEHSDLLPQDKLSVLENIIKEGKGATVFVGDGINDAPSLARADVGIAMGGIGSDAAVEAADVVIMNDSPANVVSAIRISKRTMRIVWENIIFALAVKFVILCMAIFGYADMYMAIFGDVGVTIIAILNAARCLSVGSTVLKGSITDPDYPKTNISI